MLKHFRVSDGDFLFPSVRLEGKKPITPDMVLKKVIRPAARSSGNHGRGDRLAQLPSLSGNQPESGRS